jgi:hypothetical protein
MPRTRHPELFRWSPALDPGGLRPRTLHASTSLHDGDATALGDGHGAERRPPPRSAGHVAPSMQMRRLDPPRNCARGAGRSHRWAPAGWQPYHLATEVYADRRRRRAHELGRWTLAIPRVGWSRASPRSCATSSSASSRGSASSPASGWIRARPCRRISGPAPASARPASAERVRLRPHGPLAVPCDAPGGRPGHPDTMARPQPGRCC